MWLPATRWMRAEFDQLSAPSSTLSDFHSCVESFIPKATCAAVTTVVGDWNHAVPRTPTTSDCGFRSASSKNRVMLTVECASDVGSTEVRPQLHVSDHNSTKISGQPVRTYIAIIAPSPR